MALNWVSCLIWVLDVKLSWKLTGLDGANGREWGLRSFSGMKSTPGPEQGAILELSTGECQCLLQKKDWFWWRLGLQLHKWSSETLRNGHFNHRIRNKVSFVTQHIHNGEKNSNNDSFGDVGLPNLYLGTTPPPSNLSRESQPKPSWWWLDSWVVGRPNLYPKRTQFIQKELAMEPRICLIRGDFVLVNVSLALQSPEKIHK